MSAIATTNRVFTIGDRVYPIRHRKEQPKGLPVPFPAMRVQIMGWMPLFKLNGQASEVSQVKAFSDSVTTLRAAYKDANQLFKRICQFSIEVRADAKNRARVQEIAAAKFQEMTYPSIDLKSPTILDWDLAALPKGEMFETLKRELERLCDVFIDDFIDSLETMTRQRIVGVIEWHPLKATVCRYEFYRFVVIQEHSGESVQTDTYHKSLDYSEDQVGGTWTDTVEIRQRKHKTHLLARTHRNARHQHELQAAKADSHNVQIAKPRWVHALLNAMPAWIRDLHIKIVHGDMIKELIVEVDTRIEDWTEKEEEDIFIEKKTISGNLWSPAVCLGHWVLAGWSGRELKEEKENVS